MLINLDELVEVLKIFENKKNKKKQNV